MQPGSWTPERHKLEWLMDERGSQYPRIKLDFNQLQASDIEWSPFHQGVEIHRLHGDGQSGSSSALLRYTPGARLAHHTHCGFEHVMVIAGSQSDEHGQYSAGSLIVNPPGSQHSVSSEEGCVVFVVWETPVLFAHSQ